MITFGCGAFAVCAEDVRRLAAIEEQDDGKPIVIEWARSEVQTPLLELLSGMEPGPRGFATYQEDDFDSTAGGSARGRVEGLIGSSVDVGIPRVLEFRKVDFCNVANGDDCTDVQEC